MKERVEKTIDLAALDTVKGSNAGFEVSIYNPATHEDLGLFITVLGKDSDEFQKVSRSQQKRRMEKLSKGGFRNTNIPIESIEADGIQLLAAVTKSWRQGEKQTITVGVNELPCTKDNAAALYERFPWIKEQVDIAVGDRANFINA
ncbi:MAG TPA: hypothetical protein DDX93_04695 [Smithella sp.]|jgi:hypothetical protein|nr:hypothetical protein [Smithella sp.]